MSTVSCVLTHLLHFHWQSLSTPPACIEYSVPSPLVSLWVWGLVLAEQSRAHSIPDKGSAFITWCCESQMRVRPCSAIYHPRSVSSHRGRKDLGYLFTLSSCHLFLKSTRFSVTVVYCIHCWENKHQDGGFVYTQRGLCLGLLCLYTLCLAQNTPFKVK